MDSTGGTLSLPDLDLTQRRTHILATAFAGLDPGPRRFARVDLDLAGAVTPGHIGGDQPVPPPFGQAIALKPAGSALAGGNTVSTPRRIHFAGVHLRKIQVGNQNWHKFDAEVGDLEVHRSGYKASPSGIAVRMLYRGRRMLSGPVLLARADAARNIKMVMLRAEAAV
jgi:hypothetical protein